jgi:predicted RNase H-like nuclease (RuvC/YqgF family)
MALKYKALLSKLRLAESALPSEIKQTIDALNVLEEDLEEDENDPEDIRVIQREIRELDDKICELITEEFDNETDEDETESELKEAILSRLFEQGKTKVLATELKAINYPCEHLTKGEIVGKFRISEVKKALMKPYYLIEKIK